MDKQFFFLNANCIPVHGAKKSIICDLQLCRYREIPNILYDILQLARTKTIGEVKKHFNNKYNKGIRAYLTFLAQNGWGTFDSQRERFPEISLDWISPRKLTNAIIDISQRSTFKIHAVVDQLQTLDVEALQIRFFRTAALKELADLVDYFHGISIRYIEVYLPYKETLTVQVLKRILLKNRRVRTIVIYNSPKTDGKVFKDVTIGSILYLKQNISGCESCGIISKKNFMTNLKLFTEGHHFNTCLNRKISVDENGSIKNCPSMTHSYGNFKEKTLMDAYHDPKFKELWTLTKDQIETCKDCEYRYICSDCRAYRRDSENLYSKPLKCSYNPYIGEWEK